METEYKYLGRFMRQIHPEFGNKAVELAWFVSRALLLKARPRDNLAALCMADFAFNNPVSINPLWSKDGEGEYVDVNIHFHNDMPEAGISSKGVYYMGRIYTKQFPKNEISEEEVMAYYLGHEKNMQN